MSASESTANATHGDAESVYESGTFAEIDIGASMRVGHVDVAAGDELIVSLVKQALSRHPGRATIVDIGSGSGVLSERLAASFPEHDVIANDVATSNCRRAEARLARFPNASVYSQPFETWQRPADLFISWGTHHHLPHGYLKQIRECLRPGGRFIVGDEFCPEYLSEDDLRGGRAWLIDGYLFASAAEERQLRETGMVPTVVADREEARRRALWRWYRYVVDEAIQGGHWDVALVELQIARDDLSTGFADEHKTSPLLLETELRDAGFEICSRTPIGNRPAQLQSFVIYEAVPGRSQ